MLSRERTTLVRFESDGRHKSFDWRSETLVRNTNILSIMAMALAVQCGFGADACANITLPTKALNTAIARYMQMAGREAEHSQRQTFERTKGLLKKSPMLGL